MKKEKNKSTTRNMNTLLSLAINEAYRRNQSLNELSADIGISYVYLMALARGERPASTMKRRVIDGFAKYLSISVAQACLFSGALKPSDFLVEVSASTKLDALFTRMRTDNEWNALMPTESEINCLSQDTKTFIGLLYEKASQTSSLVSALRYEAE